MISLPDRVRACLFDLTGTGAVPCRHLEGDLQRYFAQQRPPGQGGRATGGLMTQHRSFPPEPWAVRETELHLSTLAQSESIFALSNGHIGLRATSTRASLTACLART